MPAHQEEGLIGGALEALTVAADRIAPDVETSIVVVANDCTDRTAERASSMGATVIEIPHANVGAARAVGFAWLLARDAGRHDRLWLATTDADSRVPADWLIAQSEAAAAGADVYLGTVELAPHAHARFASWIARYHAAFESPDRHGHVHGASMGMWARSYQRAGGFRALDRSEDVDLVARLSAAGEDIVWDTTCPVLTSSRLTARAPAGVSRDLASSLAPAPADARVASGDARVASGEVRVASGDTHRASLAPR